MTGRNPTLITGASGGLGTALAWQAAADGHDLILSARHGDRLTELAESLTSRHSIRILTVEADLAMPDGADRLLNEVLASGWQVDHLINNAGLGAVGPLAEMPSALLADLIQVNLASLTQLSRQVLPAMLSRGHGGILHVASLAAFQPGPLMAAYYASKAYVLSLSKALSWEVRGSGVKVCCLCPGATETGFAREAGMENSRLFRTGGMSAESVARAGWRGYRKGKRVIVPGFRNKLLALLGKTTPDWIGLPVVNSLHRSA